MIAEEVAKQLEELVPPGKRSKVVNEAIMKELSAIRRKRLTEKLLKIREKCPVLTTEEIVEAVRKDRARE